MKSSRPVRNFVSAILCATAIAYALPVSAQLKETVVVEGKYNKEILYPEKLSRLPERQRISPEQNELPYELNGVPAGFTPSPSPMASTSYGAARTDIPPRGYVDLEMGSWLNTSFAAGYSPIIADNEQLNIWLRHNSTSLWQPYENTVDNLNFKRFSYQESIGGRYGRRLGDVATLTAGLRYRFGYFNYYGIEIPEGIEYRRLKLPTQTINDFSADVAVTGTRREGLAHLWNVGIGTRYFAMRSGSRETDLHLRGGYGYRFSGVSKIGIDGDMHALLYSASRYATAPDNYGNVMLNPYYMWHDNDFSVRVGATLDFTINAMGVKDNENYGIFHAAPDVRIDYNSGRFAVWAHALGGQRLTTLASNVDEDLYCLESLQSTTPFYSPIDAKIGLRVVPAPGFGAEAEFRYMLSRNVAGDGWATLLRANGMFGEYAPMPELGVAEGTLATYGLGRARYNLSGLSGRLKLNYKFSDAIEAGAEGIYTPQNASNGIFNGLDRPRWMLDASLKARPIKTLTIGLNYEYRGVRNVWSAIENVEIAGGGDSRAGTIVIPGDNGNDILEENPAGKSVGMRLPDITRLNAFVLWQLPAMGNVKNVTIGIYARNLLNQREMILPSLPTEGFRLSGSVQWLF